MTTTCTPACWTPVECDRCARPIQPHGRSVGLEAVGDYCGCEPPPPTRQHLWSVHDETRMIADPSGWAAHAAECGECRREENDRD